MRSSIPVLVFLVLGVATIVLRRQGVIGEGVGDVALVVLLVAAVATGLRRSRGGVTQADVARR